MPYEFRVGQMVTCRVFMQGSLVVGVGALENCPRGATVVWVAGRLTDIGPNGGEVCLGQPGSIGSGLFVIVPVPELLLPELSM